MRHHYLDEGRRTTRILFSDSDPDPARTFLSPVSDPSIMSAAGEDSTSSELRSRALSHFDCLREKAPSAPLLIMHMHFGSYIKLELE